MSFSDTCQIRNNYYFLEKERESERKREREEERESTRVLPSQFSKTKINIIFIPMKRDIALDILSLKGSNVV